jgi:glycosyltransferase involved in cell wall biosynthesis
VFVNDGIYAYASGAPSAVGGAERQQWLLARALARNGWSVTMGVREGVEAGKRIAIDGLEFLGIGRGYVLSAWHRFLVAEHPDWWYWRGADHLWGPAVEIAKLAGVRTIFAAAFDRDVQPNRALARRRRWWPLYALGLWRADRIMVQHRGQLSELTPRCRSKAHVVPSIAGMNVPVKPHSGRARYVSWVGMLRQPKRPDLLIEIARKAPNIHFVACGGASTHRSPEGFGQRIMSELSVTPNIEYLGQVSPETAMQTIANSAALLCTSDEEGFPNTFLQAWSNGTPVVSLKIDPDGVIERVGLGAVSRGVENAIVDLNALLEFPQRRDEIAARARRHIAVSNSEAAVVAAFESAIRN